MEKTKIFKNLNSPIKLLVIYLERDVMLKAVLCRSKNGQEMGILKMIQNDPIFTVKHKNGSSSALTQYGTKVYMP